MSDALLPYGSRHDVLARDYRRAGRAVSRQDASIMVRQAGLDGETEMTIGRLDSVRTATSWGMRAVGQVAQFEAEVVAMAPHAQRRVSFLADQHAFATAGLLDDHYRATRRW